MRHRSLLAVVVVGALALSACDWGQPGFGPDRRSANPFESTIGVDNVANLAELWSAPLAPVGSRSQVLRVGGRVLAVTNGGAADDRSTLAALDAGTGEVLWSKEYPGMGDPAYLTVGLAITTWKDRVIVARSFGTSPGELTALDIATGDVVWTVTAGARAYAEPVVAGDTIYVGSTEVLSSFTSRVSTFDAATGAPGWGHDFGSVLRPQVAVSGGRAYVTAGATLEVYDAAGVAGCTGSECQPLWTASITQGQTGSGTRPAVAGPVVYVGASGGALHAFAAHGCARPTCAPLWTGPTGGQLSTSTGPAVADDVVYVTTTGSEVMAFPAGGCGEALCSATWRGITGIGPNYGGPSVANGLVYTTGADEVRAFPTTCSGDCAPAWEQQLAGKADSSPIISGGRVYVGSAGGVQAFGLPAA